MPEPEDRPAPVAGDDTFDNLFPSDRGSRSREPQPDADETLAMPLRPAPVAKPRVGQGAQASRGQALVGSPPPPRRASLLLPWLIIGASLVILAVVGLVILSGQNSTSTAVPSSSVVTPTPTEPSSGSTRQTSRGSSSPPTSNSTEAFPPAATEPPPGFEKCAGTETGYRVTGAGTTCPFVADVAAAAAARAATTTTADFTVEVASDSTGQTYTLDCSVQEYIQCTIPATGTKTSPTYIYVMRG